MRRISLLVSLISLTAVSLYPTAFAQQNNTTATTAPRQPIRFTPRTIPVRKEQPLEFRAQNLDREVALPNLPGYTGKQIFVGGLMYPNARETPGYYLQFNTEHTQDQVKQWWSQALKTDPWKISFSDDATIKANSKDGANCTITAGPALTATPDKMKGMHGGYTIYFHASPSKAQK